jgi:hypothetical protein
MSTEEVKITKADLEWNDFIMKQFDESELVDGKPKYAGIRRVFEKVYAKILSSTTEIIKPPTSSDMCATVKCTIIAEELDGGAQLMQEGAADVSMASLEAPYNLHLVATAETKAEGRALRKLLGLRTITADEAVAGGDPDAFAAPEQRTRGIQNMIKRLGINGDKFLAKQAGISTKMLESTPGALSKDQADKILVLLNDYVAAGVPDEFKTT